MSRFTGDNLNLKSCMYLWLTSEVSGKSRLVINCILHTLFMSGFILWPSKVTPLLWVDKACHRHFHRSLYQLEETLLPYIMLNSLSDSHNTRHHTTKCLVERCATPPPTSHTFRRTHESPPPPPPPPQNAWRAGAIQLRSGHEMYIAINTS